MRMPSLQYFNIGLLYDLGSRVFQTLKNKAVVLLQRVQALD